MADPNQTTAQRPHQRMVYQDEKIAELMAENARLRAAMVEAEENGDVVAIRRILSAALTKAVANNV